MIAEKESFNVKDYLNRIVQEPLKIFREFVLWTDKDKEEFKLLLDILRSSYDKKIETTKSKGDRLEQLVDLGECKNYASDLGVTYVGKFYSLMTVSNVSMGIIFTQKGLTGKPEGYKDAYGLTKVLRMIENSKNKDNDFYILTFSDEDYDKLLKGTTFFELIEAKKLEL